MKKYLGNRDELAVNFGKTENSEAYFIFTEIKRNSDYHLENNEQYYSSSLLNKVDNTPRKWNYYLNNDTFGNYKNLYIVCTLGYGQTQIEKELSSKCCIAFRNDNFIISYSIGHQEFVEKGLDIHNEAIRKIKIM